MKPKSKLQKRILKLSQSLPPLTDYQRKSAIKKVAPHIAKYSKKNGYVCLECGHQWKDEKTNKVTCPHCGTKLTVDDTRKWTINEKYYFAVVTRCKEFQVVRMFLMQIYLKKGQPASHWMEEAFQKWITSEGRVTIVGRKRHWFGFYCDLWDWSSNMEIRNECNVHYMAPDDIVGHSSVIPAIRRNGFKGKFHHCSPATLFTLLLTDNRFETIWKTKQTALARYCFSYQYNLNQYWPSIKIAIRHNYKIRDPSMWFDMLGALQRLGKDLRNPQLICPVNLKEAHDKWIVQNEVRNRKERERRIRQRELEEEQRYFSDPERVKNDEVQYQQVKSKFFNLIFEDNELVIKPLTSVKEFVEETRVMHHCVFSHKYFQKQDALILHALVNNSPIATIEFSLNNFSVVQCRGPYNQRPEQYNQIMALMKKNVKKIMSKAA